MAVVAAVVSIPKGFCTQLCDSTSWRFYWLVFFIGLMRCVSWRIHADRCVVDKIEAVLLPRPIFADTQHVRCCWWWRRCSFNGLACSGIAKSVG